jgi:wyosine [tRNA(Phe)-imidazoG37] synthetase (radical SAM superfamily)
MLPLQEGLVYGPVRSRRLGHSLGVNILPRNAKTCTFNCTYCQYGWTKTPAQAASELHAVWPSPASVAKAVAVRLQRARAVHESVDRITLAGNGEPTLHPEFSAIVEHLTTVRNQLAPAVPLAILSNAATLELPGVVDALNGLDERYMKLDAGDTAILRRMNGTTLSVEQILVGLRRLNDIVVQSMFVRDRLGRIDNAGDIAVAQWINLLGGLAPRAVHIYSIDRAPAWPYLQAIPFSRLEEIARRACAAGLKAQAFGGVGL